MLSEIALREVLVSPESLYGVPKVPPVWTYIVALHRRRRCQTSRLCHTSGQMLGPQNQPPVPALRANAPADPPHAGAWPTPEEAGAGGPKGRRKKLRFLFRAATEGWGCVRSRRASGPGGSVRGPVAGLFEVGVLAVLVPPVPSVNLIACRKPCLPQAFWPLVPAPRASDPCRFSAEWLAREANPPSPPPAKWTRLELASQSLALSHFLSNHTRLLTWPFSFSNPGFNCSNLKN